MKTPSGRNLIPSSAGYLFLERLEKDNKPVIAIDTADAVTAKVIHSNHANYFEGF
jgi:hypothetical protein